MSTRILILKDGVITPSRSSGDISNIVTSLGLTKSSVGLNLVDNTSDLSKPISTATQTALDLKANLVSPALTGTPTTPTATAGTNTTQIASTAFVSTAISNLVASSPAALDTLNELAAALGNDANFSTTITNSLALKAPLASPTFTGTVNGVTASMVGLGNVNNTSDANKPVSTATQTALDLKANLISPSLTTPNLGTPSAGILTNTTGLPLTTGVTGILGISNGGTGSSSQNFVDLTTNQNIAGIKTWTNTTESTSVTTGSSIYNGGVGIAKNLWVGGSINQSINYTFKAANSTFQTIPNATFTKIILDSEVSDTNSQYNPTLSRLVASTTETWRINLYITFNLESNNRIILYIYKNGSDTGGLKVMDNPTLAGFFGQTIIIPEISLVPGDYLEVFCYLSPGGSIYGDGTLASTYWFGKRVN